MNGAAAACTLVMYVPSPTKNCENILPLTLTLPVNLEPNCTSCPLPVAPVVTMNAFPL